MIDAKPDRLEALLNSYREKIGQHQAEIARLQERLSLVEEVLKDLKQLPLLPTEVSGSSTRYAGWRITKACLDALGRIGNGGITAQDIAHYLSSNGYRHENPKWFLPTTITTLKRLAKAGQIITERTDDRRVYRMKV